jgi:acyl-CoA dehydrogenase
MRDKSYLDWPFFDAKHRVLAAALEDWAARHLSSLIDHGDIDGSCRALVAALGKDRWLDHAVPGDGGFDLRSLCLIREILASHSALADFAFAMQGLGTGAITLFGTPAQKAA